MTAKDFLYKKNHLLPFGLIAYDELVELMEEYAKKVRNDTIEEIADKFGDFPFQLTSDDILKMKIQ